MITESNLEALGVMLRVLFCLSGSASRIRYPDTDHYSVSDKRRLDESRQKLQ